nr:zinc permease [Pyrinomonadaceae bacterium]
NERARETERLEVATMIAAGVGLHNFAVGLAIGQSFASGAVGLGAAFIVGFTLHNATEGFSIAAPLVGREVSWIRLAWLGTIAAAPHAVGAAAGGVWINSKIELLCLSAATGALLYVTREVLLLHARELSALGSVAVLASGFLIGFVAELTVEVLLKSM